MPDSDSQYESIDEVTFIEVYAMDVEHPVYRYVHDDLKKAHEDGQKLILSGVTEIRMEEGRHVFHPPHRIVRYELIKAKRYTERIEKSDTPGIPDLWHGHYEDADGNVINY